ncbi:MAG: hypothetical protein JNK72_06350 [Myxococcales bacterium]|nr:hypothetical protein [Myxococcales bacterium]
MSPEAAALTRAASTPSARLRVLGERLQARRRARWVSGGDGVPPPRSPAQVWEALARPETAVTELEVARLAAALLRGCGDSAEVALRERPRRREHSRSDVAALGSWLVRSGDQLLDLGSMMVLGASAVPHTVLNSVQLAAALDAAAAIEVSTAAEGRAAALGRAESAVNGWRDGWLPLAARATVWVNVGASSGLDHAARDLSAAIALSDDAGLHLARARVLLGQRRLVEVAFETQRALQMAPGFTEAAMASMLLHRVYAQLDGGAPSGCEALHLAHQPTADLASVLCAEGQSEASRAQAATQLVARSTDPLVLAYAGRALGPSAAPTLRQKTTLAAARRELVGWLEAAGESALLAALVPQDGGL